MLPKVLDVILTRGASFKIRKGEVLRVYDPCGEQVADLFAFKDGDLACSLSSGRSIDYASRIYLSIGDVLYSNDSQRMFTIIADTVGRHDFLLTPCSQEMFEILHHCQGHHANCFENLCSAFEAYGVKPAQISTTFNIFMNVKVDAGGQISVEPPTSRPGDFIELRADMDMVCALTACSAEQSNNGAFKPIDYEVVTRPCN
ncbi:MAG: urea carboxylase-associated family protein [Betaproteobacteria bacterium]